MTSHTIKTDIIISIHPPHVANIVRRTKNHEYRNYLIPHTVKRLWIYETSPVSAIKYVATISHGKRPGEVAEDGGIGNSDFNQPQAETTAKYAYEILRLEALETPLTMHDLKSRSWLGGPPQKYCYVRGAMIDEMGKTKMKFLFDSCQSKMDEVALQSDQDTENKSKFKHQEKGPSNSAY